MKNIENVCINMYNQINLDEKSFYFIVLNILKPHDMAGSPYINSYVRYWHLIVSVILLESINLSSIYINFSHPTFHIGIFFCIAAENITYAAMCNGLINFLYHVSDASSFEPVCFFYFNFYFCFLAINLYGKICCAICFYLNKCLRNIFFKCKGW